MSCRIFILSDAEDDLYDIYRYVATYDSIDKAEKLFNKLKETCYSLSKIPGRDWLPDRQHACDLFWFVCRLSVVL